MGCDRFYLTASIHYEKENREKEGSTPSKMKGESFNQRMLSLII